MEKITFMVLGIGCIAIFLFLWWKLTRRKTPEELACSPTLFITGMAAWGIAVTVIMFIGFTVSIAAPPLLGL